MPAQQSSIVSKCIKIMEILAASEKPLRLSEIIARTGFAKPNTHRLLNILVAEHMISVDKVTATYSIGMRPVVWAIKGWQQSDIRQTAADGMDALHRLTGENVLLAVPDGSTLVYMDKRESQKSLRIVSSIGNRAPLHCTGLGKAMLAFMDAARQSAIISEMTLEPYTKNTITSEDALREDLAHIRLRGHSIDNCEHQSEINCIAAPVFNFQNNVAGAISISAPTFRENIDQLLTYADQLLDITNEISLRLGFEPKTGELKEKIFDRLDR